MNIGDYVRTTNGISKIVAFYSNAIFNDKNKRIENNLIIKSSPNIIDLIEVGDIVNYEQLNGGVVLNKKEDSIDTWYILPNNLKNEDIKSVITKEQIEQMEYKINE